MDGDYKILMMPDHPTPVEVKKHTNEPVPYVMYKKGGKGGNIKKYSEQLIMKAHVGAPVEAFKLMNMLKKT